LDRYTYNTAAGTQAFLNNTIKREAIPRARQRLAGQRVARTGTTWTFGLSIASPEASCTGPRQSRPTFQTEIGGSLFGHANRPASDKNILKA
jgi:hypothetical protein